MYSIPVSLQLNFYSMVLWYMESYAFSFSIKREKQILVASSRKLDASFQKKVVALHFCICISNAATCITFQQNFRLESSYLFLYFVACMHL